MNNAQLKRLFEEEYEKKHLEDIEEEARLVHTPPLCPICGLVGFGVGWMHQDCKNRLARLQMTPEARMRERWNGMAKRIRPLVFSIHGDLCITCGDPANTIDHTFPISRGGTNEIGNLRPMCGPCNSRKRDKVA